VASSNINILGFFKNSLAIDNLCFSHQLSFNHLSHITVFIQFSKSKTKFASAFFIASFISLLVALGLANKRFSFMLRLNRLLS
jgi:hypothetical protein